MSRQWSGWGWEDMQRKIGKNEELAIGKGSSTCNDGIGHFGSVGDDTVTIAWVEMGRIAHVAKKEDRDKSDSRIGNVEGVIEY